MYKRQPLAPAEDQEITCPDVSEIETIVLLNVLWICTTPLGTLRLDFFEPVFFTVAAIMFNLILELVNRVI